MNSGKIFLQMTSYSLRFKVFNFAAVKKLNYHMLVGILKFGKSKSSQGRYLR